MVCAMPASLLVPTLALALLVSPTPGVRAAPPAPRWEPANTWALVAGVLHWSDPALAPFEANNRKDLELMNVLAERGVPPAQRTLLIDRHATAARVREVLAEQVAAAPPGTTFIVYFEGHGLFDQRRRFVLATSDTHTDHLDHTGLDLAALLPILATRGARDRVLLFGDACYSGHFAALASALTFLGVPALSLTSASEESASSENWTFTQALIDGLRGRAIVDRDGDGAILLSEIAAEARDAMRHREGQPIGWAPLAVGDLVIANAAPWPPDLAALAPAGNLFSRGDWVVARRLDGERGIGRVLGVDPDGERGTRLRLEYYDYADRLFGWAREDRADPVMFYVYPPGTRVRVSFEDSVYAATVVRVEDGLHLVSFEGPAPGAPEPHDPTLPADEFVTQDQLLGHLDPSEEAVQRVLVEAGGALYEALVKGRFRGKVCVRYPGSPLVEDDCVPESRVTPDTRRP